MNELPTLPEGYHEDGTRLYFGNEVLAEYDPDFLPSLGLIFFGGYENGEACMGADHAQAIAIWLQRRASK